MVSDDMVSDDMLSDHFKYLCPSCYSKNTPAYDSYCTPCQHVTDNIVEVLESRIVVLKAVSKKLETEPDLKQVVDSRIDRFIHRLDTITGKKQM
jgi:hypothetical protein